MSQGGPIIKISCNFMHCKKYISFFHHIYWLWLNFRVVHGPPCPPLATPLGSTLRRAGRIFDGSGSICSMWAPIAIRFSISSFL
uniref:Uncharacterized protein n=1 Tax=Hordeum vulgare subsp. vulgare TaxID=112509 RepID=A0A8I7BID8_HORVV